MGVIDTQRTDSSPDAAYAAKDRGYFAHARPEMVEMLPATATRILDVGCSSGQFGRLVKDANPQREVWGVELHRDAARRAAEVLDHVIVGEVPTVFDDLPDKHFDCVVFNDVLEHLVDPYHVLAITKDKLSAGGHVVASIPNIREFHTLAKLVFQKRWDYTDAGILDRTHLRFFTESSIRDLFENQGYEIECLRGINRNWRRFPKLINLLTLGVISDTMYLQFACRARYTV